MKADVYEELMLPTTTHEMKVDRLMVELPNMGEGFLQNFIKCLRVSVEEEPGTSHGRLADALEEELLQNTAGN